MSIDKAKGRELLMGIHEIVNFKGDEEAVEVLENAKAYCEKHLAELSRGDSSRSAGKRGADRSEKTGMDRSR